MQTFTNDIAMMSPTFKLMEDYLKRAIDMLKTLDGGDSAFINSLPVDPKILSIDKLGDAQEFRVRFSSGAMGCELFAINLVSNGGNYTLESITNETDKEIHSYEINNCVDHLYALVCAVRGWSSEILDVHEAKVQSIQNSIDQATRVAYNSARQELTKLLTNLKLLGCYDGGTLVTVIEPQSFVSHKAICHFETSQHDKLCVERSKGTGLLFRYRFSIISQDTGKSCCVTDVVKALSKHVGEQTIQQMLEDNLHDLSNVLDVLASVTSRQDVLTQNTI